MLYISVNLQCCNQLTYSINDSHISLIIDFLLQVAQLYNMKFKKKTYIEVYI